jgi:hypothetical protein
MTEPTPRRRQISWADVPALLPPDPGQVELLGLGVLVAVLERMSSAERRRALVYLADRYGEKAAASDDQ